MSVEKKAYNSVFAFDFTSLYPNVMRSFNSPGGDKILKRIKAIKKILELS